MIDEPSGTRREMMSDALEQLRSALQLLDGAEAPAEIGAKIDLAIHELFLALAAMSARGALAPVDRHAEPQ